MEWRHAAPTCAAAAPFVQPEVGQPAPLYVQIDVVLAESVRIHQRLQHGRREMMHTHHLSLDCRSQHQRVLELSHLLPMQLELALRVDVEQQQQQQQQQQQHRDRVQEVDSRGPAQRNGSQRSHLLSARQRGRGHRRDERPPSRMIADLNYLEIA